MPSGSTHLKVGLITTAALACGLGVNIDDMPVIWSAAIVGSLFPDADHRKSFIGSLIPLWLIWKHRGFTHSFHALLLFTCVVHILAGELFACYFAWGYFTHLFLDAWTPRGIICKKLQALFRRLRRWNT